MNLNKCLYCSIVFFMIIINSPVSSRNLEKIDTKCPNLLYDLKTGRYLKGIWGYYNGSSLANAISFRDLPFSCKDLQCGYCTGLNITFFKYKSMCTNMTFLPKEFSVKIDLSLDDEIVFSHKLSGQNPPPACLPVPYLPFLSMCFRVHKIQVVDKKFQACLDLEARIIQYSVLVLHFNCMSVSANGIQAFKPEVSAQKTFRTSYLQPWEISKFLVNNTVANSPKAKRELKPFIP